MRIGPIVLQIRAADTRFKNKVGGSAELAAAMTYTLKDEMAFVVQMSETAGSNIYDSGINQLVTERFAVVVALQNDLSEKDKLGLIAYDKLFDVRSEIFKAILGWQIPGAESITSYSNGRIVKVDRAYLWYQFEFTSTFRLTDENGYNNGADELGWLDTIYAQWILTPSAKMDVIGNDLPITIVDPDMTTLIDFTTNPAVEGGFNKGFNIIFDTYKP